ncbi:hypothetical protein GEV33_004692 [Tenebrio molitor]|uniref:Uncharacterized protein n=1 Tax=Tenebrio molitor TaxID=7067 RepID=A0A8J6HP90_TENMO|nr:hypothetical protein GEV33_004692 [Tenebrio molitor]
MMAAYCRNGGCAGSAVTEMQIRTVQGHSIWRYRGSNETNLVKTLPTQVQVKEFDENYGDNRQRGRLLAVTLA